MSILITNGRIVTAVDDYFADILIEGEKIARIGKDLDVHADTVLDAKDRLVFPGGVDAHTHFDMPFGGTVSADDFESGTKAAAFGGTTTVIDFAIQTKGSSTIKGLDLWHEKAAGKATIDYGFHMIVTDMPEERLGEMERLACEGVTSYKLFMAYPGVLYVDDGTLYRAFRQAGQNGTRISMHAENGIVIDEIIKGAIRDGKTSPIHHALTRPTRMEAEGVHRAIAIAEVADVPLYIVHLSCSDALDQVKLARMRGVDVIAETCPQYLFLDQSIYEGHEDPFAGAKWVMTPALREKWNQDVLWSGLKFGHLATVATDHCPFCYKDQKELGRDSFTNIPNGAPGVENRMSLLFDGGVVKGRMSLNRFVEVTSTAPAKTFGLFPKKGTIAVGSDADLVIFDPKRKETISVDNEFTHHMRVDYSAYEGYEVQGWSETVLSRGRIIAQKGTLVTEGGGEFIKRARVGELLR
ncbi:MAG: dihydropyrimidinase [Rickettsiales bacterium]|nr:dihydropyrimidinase [Rickettsiales bacterium]|tara:strand:- start:1878 stop:3278 length:1401 start_codon:yes stop_codon:yes gene_type:complete